MKDVKKIGFLGFGRSNRALFDYISSEFSIDTVIRDERKTIDCNISGARLLLGEKCFDFAGEDIIFLSPSVRRDRACVARLAELGAVFSSDAELFFSQGLKNVLAVTGSDGKSTTSALAGAMLAGSNMKTFVAGNFGLPMTPLSENKDAYFVTELSSFMLSYIKPHSRRALITNITPNHLNWHSSLEEYALAKENILINAKERVLSYDCPYSRELIKKLDTYAVFSVKTPFNELKRAVNANTYCTFESGVLLKNGKSVIEREKFPPLGIHNVKNALAAICLTDGICDADAAKGALSEFRGLDHRCKNIYSACGIDFYDSSIDSSPERTRATLEVFDKPVTLILGGRDKGLDYEPLRDAVANHAGAVILCGENAKRLGKFLENSRVPCPLVYVSDYREAVLRAFDFGLDVLLSPASTSYDRFLNFEERGKAFLDEVKKYAREHLQE